MGRLWGSRNQPKWTMGGESPCFQGGETHRGLKAIVMLMHNYFASPSPPHQPTQDCQ